MNPLTPTHPPATRSILRKVLVTTVTGGMTYTITNSAQDSLIWNITLTAFIGSVTLVIQFLIDFESRLGAVEYGHRRHVATVERLVSEGFSKVSQATDLFGQVEASRLRTDVVIQLVRHSVNIKPTSPPLVHALAQAELSRVTEFMREFSGGTEVTYDGEDRDWLLALTRNVRSTIDATSISVSRGGRGLVDEGLWASDLGQRYLEAQRDAVDRDVAIRRLFILDSPGLGDDPALLRICLSQREIGVQVRILGPSAIPGKRRSQLLDFVIFDSAVSYEMTSTPRIGRDMETVIANTRLVLAPHRVAERVQGFKDLWASADEFDESKAMLIIDAAKQERRARET